MLIRHADGGRDGDGCAAIYTPFVRESAVSFEENVPTGAEFAARIARIERTHPWLIADEGGAVAGFAYGCGHRERPAYRWAADVAVYVSAGRQRRGIGRALYGGLLPLLGRQGLRIACAGITLPNDASVALHEACGFLPVGVFRRIGFKAGGWRDVGWWQLELLPPDDEQPPEPGPPATLEGLSRGARQDFGVSGRYM